MLEPHRILVGAEEAPFSDAAVAGGLEISTSCSESGTGLRVDVTVRNPGSAPVTPRRVGVAVPAALGRVLEHGWQSWSVVRRCAPTDRRPERARSPNLVKRMQMADPAAAGTAVAGDQFLLWDAGVAGHIDGARHLSTVEAGPDGPVAWALLDEIALAPGEEMSLDPLWIAAGDPGHLYSELADRWAAETGARAAAATPPGWCSWYHYFAAVTPEDVNANTALAAAHGLAVVQIDDGWQAAAGDWLATAPGWAAGTAASAERIRSAGLTAGLWTAPFLASESSRLVADHPEWLVRRPDGREVRSAWNRAWGGWAYALDATHPGVLEHLRSTFAALRAQGFDYHKIDFCYAAAAPGVHHDPTATRAVALRRALQAVRDGIGDDAFLLGCGCPFAQAVGIVDAMRVSPDVNPTWGPQAELPGFDDTLPSLRAAVSASVLRAPLHRRLWANDPDCLMLRSTSTDLEEWHRMLQAAVVAGTGGFAIISDDLALLGEEEWGALDKVLSVLPGADGPLDIVDPFAPGLVVRSPTTELAVTVGDGPAPQLPPATGPVLFDASGPGGAARLSRLDRPPS